VQLKEWQKAIEDCERALKLDPSYTKARKTKAKALGESGDWEEAVKELKAIAESNPEEPGIAKEIRNAELELKKSKRKDYYKILGVEKDADDNQIKKAYRKLAIIHHPDKVCDSPFLLGSILEANLPTRTKEMKLLQTASRTLVRHTRLCRIPRSALVMTAVRISLTPRNSSVEVVSVAWAVVWARKSTPRCSSRCLVDRWAAAASEAVWAVVAAEEVVAVASPEASTSDERTYRTRHSGPGLLHVDLLVLDHGKEVSQSSSTFCPRIYVGRFLFSSGSPLPCSYLFGMTEQARDRLFRGIAYGIGVCYSRKSLQSGYRLSGIHSCKHHFCDS
jgi:hypothetical protein